MVTAYEPGRIYIQSSANSAYTATFSYPPVAPAPKPLEENEMLSKDHVFPYTGNQIAKAIGDKLDGLIEKQSAVEAIDDSTLSALGGGLAKDAADRKANRLKELAREIERWEQEQRAYEQAADNDFDLDLEDVARFGL